MRRPTPPADRRWKNRPLVLERDTRLQRWLWGMLLAIIVALAPGGVYMLHQSECLKLAYELNDLRAEAERLSEERRRLTAELARLESPPRIEAWAQRRQDLVQPPPEHVVVVESVEPQAVKLMAGRIDPR